MLLQGTLGGHFDIFAASGEFTAWVLLWKTRSRPIGVSEGLSCSSNSISSVRARGHWLCSGRRTLDISLS